MPKLRFCALPMGSNLWQSLKTFNLFRLLENETLDIFSVGGRSKSKQILSNESLQSWRGKRIFYKSWNWKWSFRLVCKFSLDFRKISCFISKNILSKVVLKYEVSMLTCPSTVHLAHPKIHFRIIRTVNPLSQRYINRKFQKYISVSICHGHRASFMRPLFIAFKNDEWCHFVVRIGSPVETPEWSFEGWVNWAFSVTQLAWFSLGEIWVISYLHLPFRITVCRISPWN